MKFEKGRFAYLAFCLLFSFTTVAQPVPIECNDDLMVAVASSNRYQISKVELEDSTYGLISFTDENEGFFNGMGYSIWDRTIYGSTENGLVRIDGTGETLELGVRFGGVNADVSPDGRFLYSISTSLTRIGRVDLTSNEYLIEYFDLLDNNASEESFCTDMAFDPTQPNRMYGYDPNNSRLVYLDIDTKEIHTVAYTILESTVPAIFFDAFGELYGFAWIDDATTFIHINKNTGDITQIANKDVFPAGMVAVDGCSCPYTIKLQKAVYPKITFPCTELQFSYKFTNQTGFVTDGIVLTDTLPTSFEIQEVSALPQGAVWQQGTASNILRIENINLAESEIDSISVKVAVPELFGEQDYSGYAYLKNVNNQAFQPNIVRSDDPSTLLRDDPTAFSVRPLFVDLSNNSRFLCEDSTLELRSNVVGGTFYDWSTGEDTETIQVSEPGWYAVTVDTGCEVASDSILVIPNQLEIYPLSDTLVSLGDTIQIMPTYNSDTTIVRTTWYDERGNTLAECAATDCIELGLQVLRSQKLSVVLEDAAGCQVSATINVRADYQRPYFAANIITANGDGVNDFFFIQSKASIEVLEMNVFNRWGGLVFRRQNVMSNQAEEGWDGYTRGQIEVGVYIWQAKVRWPDGFEEVIAGEVTVVL